MIKVRRLAIGGYNLYRDRVEELLRQLSPQGTTIHSDLIRRCFERSDVQVFGALIDGELVGIAVGTIKFHLTGCELYIDDVVVDESHRGFGVGSALMDELEKYARARECSGVQLTSSRADAQRFYESRGYRSGTTAYRKTFW